MQRGPLQPSHLEATAGSDWHHGSEAREVACRPHAMEPPSRLLRDPYVGDLPAIVD